MGGRGGPRYKRPVKTMEPLKQCTSSARTSYRLVRSIVGRTWTWLREEDNELFMKQIAHVLEGVARSGSKATAATEKNTYTAKKSSNGFRIDLKKLREPSFMMAVC
jgi:hypothetical protein